MCGGKFLFVLESITSTRIRFQTISTLSDCFSLDFTTTTALFVNKAQSIHFPPLSKITSSTIKRHKILQDEFTTVKFCLKQTPNQTTPNQTTPNQTNMKQYNLIPKSNGK
eukprot:m.35635 g.35635  ORF g.35635 m.35635 type:complete len:110 (-) comp6616_c1_seq1:461-790(-)